MLQSLKAPRYCDITRQPMIEGWVTANYLYIKNEGDAIQHAKELGYANLQEAFDDEYMHWTSWVDEPEVDWHPIPQELLMSTLLHMHEDLISTVEDHGCMPEIVDIYEELLNAFKSIMP